MGLFKEFLKKTKIPIFKILGSRLTDENSINTRNTDYKIKTININLDSIDKDIFNENFDKLEDKFNEVYSDFVDVKETYNDLKEEVTNLQEIIEYYENIFIDIFDNENINIEDYSRISDKQLNTYFRQRKINKLLNENI